MSTCSHFRALYNRYTYSERISCQHLLRCPHPQTHSNISVEACYTSLQDIYSQDDLPFFGDSITSLHLTVRPQYERDSIRPFLKNVKELHIISMVDSSLGNVPRSAEKLVWKHRSFLTGLDLRECSRLKYVDFDCRVCVQVLRYLPPCLETLILRKDSFNLLSCIGPSGGKKAVISHDPPEPCYTRALEVYLPPSLRFLSIATINKDRTFSTDTVDPWERLVLTFTND